MCIKVCLDYWISLSVLYFPAWEHLKAQGELMLQCTNVHNSGSENETNVFNSSFGFITSRSVKITLKLWSFDWKGWKAGWLMASEGI